MPGLNKTAAKTGSSKRSALIARNPAWVAASAVQARCTFGGSEKWYWLTHTRASAQVPGALLNFNFRQAKSLLGAKAP